eukprot:1768095-Lingulodinium_polyedra.AAC.1
MADASVSGAGAGMRPSRLGQASRTWRRVLLCLGLPPARITSCCAARSARMRATHRPCHRCRGCEHCL